MSPEERYVRLPKRLLGRAGLSCIARDLLLLLDDHKNPQTGLCCPRVTTLAREMKVTPRTIKRALARLRSVGLIRVLRGQRGNRYEIESRSEWASSMGTKMSPRKKSHGDKSVPLEGDKNVPSEPTPSITQLKPKVTRTEKRERHDSRGLQEHSTANGSGSASAGALFSLFWARFVEAGVPLNGRDKKQAKRLFNRYPGRDQQRICDWVAVMLLTQWRSPEFTPSPVNALRSEGWTRTAAPRSVPRKPTEIEMAVARVYARRRAEGKL